MKNIVYIQKANDFNDVIINQNVQLPILCKKIIYQLKKIFQILTKKKIENKEVWLLPINNYSEVKIKKLILQLIKYTENEYVFPIKLMSETNIRLMKKYELSYLDGHTVKNSLVPQILQYIYTEHNDFKTEEISILVETTTNYSISLIRELLKTTKSLKIVTSNYFQWKELEKELYQEDGIAMQFTNSYRRSLAKSKIIINLDKKTVDVNEYNIYPEAIIINGTQENLTIKNKSFHGIVVNSCQIHFQGEKGEYDNLIYYESLLKQEKSTRGIFARIKKDKVIVSDLIGNHGRIAKKELKNLL